jgi:hypothetical protein
MNDSTNRSVQESNQLAQQLKDLSAALNDSLNRFRVMPPQRHQKPPLPAAFSSDAYNAVGSRGLRFFALALAGSGVAGHHGVTIQQQATVQRLPEPVPRTDFTQRRCTALAVATGGQQWPAPLVTGQLVTGQLAQRNADCRFGNAKNAPAPYRCTLDAFAARSAIQKPKNLPAAGFIVLPNQPMSRLAYA